MKNIISLTLFLSLFFLNTSSFSQQGFLHADGINIVNGAGENVLLRGIGTGNWMLMEGYMMKTEGFAGTQHQIRAKLNEEIGVEKTDEFFETWLANHFTKTDVDSMKAWGFNSVRVAMHYKWFTLPIEEEPTAGNNTWINKGFEMMDELLGWCADNEMYLILDLHGAPGGQGANADISDYDPSKPSLWESQRNKDKTIALWKKLAERYANETWMGGYDLINETNWTFPEGNNSQMRKLFGDITDAIREVDQNHIIFIEGNSFANDHSGLTPPWDDNLVYSFHKYWSGTGKGELDWILSLRDAHNVPLWLGETGENSNSWFTETIELSESHNIGWSWWPVKKEGINNVMQVKMPSSYETLIQIWKNETNVVFSEDEVFDAVMDWAENHKIENCEIKYDVIDAMFRQPHTNETKPFKHHTTEATIFATDYDYGRNGYAYFDQEVGFYGGEYVNWNAGWAYRNDGVDIERCSDAISNGYNVGWTAKGEWMAYTIEVEKEAAYTFELRYAAEPSNGQFHLELDNANIITNKYLPGTGGWGTWGTYTVDNVVLKKGTHQLKFVINNSGFNINYFAFTNPVSLTKIDPEIIHLRTDETGKYIRVISNLGFDNAGIPSSSDFNFEVNNSEVEITKIEVDAQNNSVLLLESNIDLIKADQLFLSYISNSMLSPFDDPYPTFSKVAVENLSPDFVILPAKIEAESYLTNNGFELENCTDTGGGQN
nr:cellulase family glycosylhydrolase [Prolixibacteraceae bacterium]